MEDCFLLNCSGRESSVPRISCCHEAGCNIHRERSVSISTSGSHRFGNILRFVGEQSLWMTRSMLLNSTGLSKQTILARGGMF